jgi:hypothetical protein
MYCRFSFDWPCCSAGMAQAVDAATELRKRSTTIATAPVLSHSRPLRLVGASTWKPGGPGIVVDRRWADYADRELQLFSRVVARIAHLH